MSDAMIIEARSLADYIHEGPMRTQPTIARAAVLLTQLADRLEIAQRGLTEAVARQLADNIPIGMPQGERDLIASYLVREWPKSIAPEHP